MEVKEESGAPEAGNTGNLAPYTENSIRNSLGGRSSTISMAVWRTAKRGEEVTLLSEGM